MSITLRSVKLTQCRHNQPKANKSNLAQLSITPRGRSCSSWMMEGGFISSLCWRSSVKKALLDMDGYNK